MFLMRIVCPENTADCSLPVSPRSPFVERPLESNTNALNSIAFNRIGQGGVLAGVARELNAAIVRQIKADREVLDLKIFRLHGAKSLGAHFAFEVQPVIQELGTQCQPNCLLTTQRVLGIVESNIHRWGDLRNPMTELIGQELRALRGLNESAYCCCSGVGGDEST